MLSITIVGFISEVPFEFNAHVLAVNSSGSLIALKSSLGNAAILGVSLAHQMSG
jgi:hypothetical protein